MGLSKTEALLKKLKDDSGSTMVEAAVVFPIVIFSMTVLVFILSIMYSQTASNVKLHMALNEAAGRESETVFTESKVPEVPGLQRGAGVFRRVWKGSAGVSFEGILFLNGFEKELESSAYEIDEEKYIRIIDLIREE